MTTPLSNYTGANEPDLGDPNATASAQVAGGVASVTKALDGHNHTAGKGLPVPFSALSPDTTLDCDGNPVIAVTYVTFSPIAAGSVPNVSLFVDSADGLLKFRDGTGTLRTVDTTP